MDNCKLTNKAITIKLLFYSFIISMIFFAVVRAFGFLWFTQENVNIHISWYAEKIIMFVYLVFECTLVARILTPLKWKFCLLIAVIYKCFLYLVYSLSPSLLFTCDLVYIIIFPLLCSKGLEEKIKSVIHSLYYIAFIGIYVLIMRFGRYDMIQGKTNVVWQILSTFDYKLFLVVIVLGKELIKMDSGCLLWWGKFDNVCIKIGKILLKPFMHD